MSEVKSNFDSIAGVCTISVIGNFDFNIQQELTHAYTSADMAKEYVLDLSGTSFIDSSALGMLLALRRLASSNDAKVKIIRCSDDVLAIFKIANFQNLFEIS